VAIGLLPCNNIVIPAITIKGQLLTFYKILFSDKLTHAIQMENYIAEKTVVHCHTSRPHLSIEIPNRQGEMINTQSNIHFKVEDIHNLQTSHEQYDSILKQS
jgi:hypothetical protein